VGKSRRKVDPFIRCGELAMNWGCFQDFRFNEDRTKVQCKICVGRETWIAARSAAAHLLSATHLQAVRLATERSAEIQRRNEILEREREADSATDELRDIQFAAHHFPGPVTAKSSGMSAAEAEMWEDYRVNGVEFSAGDPPEDPEAQHQELRRQAEIFGLWNPVAMARRLGFGDDAEPGDIEEDPEDDFLAEILGNIGEFVVCCELVESRFEFGHMIVIAKSGIVILSRRLAFAMRTAT
jgi:hypothetical protein